MPGLHLLSSDKNEPFGSKLKDVKKSMYYEFKEILVKENLMIGFTKYDNYPLEIFEDADFMIIVEGYVYNREKESLKECLVDIALDSHTGELSHEKLKDFLSGSDGEFIVLIYNKSNENLYIFNDILGELPLFYYYSGDSLLVSREMKFIIPFVDSIKFYKEAIIEYLLYFVAFGDRTLIEDIYQMVPATLLKYNAKDKKFSKNIIIPINFDETKKFEGSEVENENLKKLFIEGIKNRLKLLGENKKAVIGLSGGLDSRVILAGITSCNVKPYAVTYDTVYGRGIEKDYYTSKIAKVFDAPLSDITPKEGETEEERMRLNYEKYNKLINLNMFYINYITDFNMLEEVTNMYGRNILYFGGNYGNEISRTLDITSGIKSDDDLVNYVLSNPDFYFFNPENVCKMLNVTMKDLNTHFKKHFSTYQEKNLYRKYAHFAFERAYKKNLVYTRQFFFWLTPIYHSVPFFNYIMKIPNEKKDTLFFRNFMYAVDPRTCDVGYYNFSMKLKSTWQLQLFRVPEKIAQDARGRKLIASVLRLKGKPNFNVKKMLTKKGSDYSNARLEERKKLLISLLSNSNEIKKVFLEEETKKIINDQTNFLYLSRFLTIFLNMRQVEKFKKKLPKEIESLHTDL